MQLPREQPLTRNRFGGDCERVHGASSGCWPSAESFHTGRAIMYTRPDRPVASVQAQHFQITLGVRPQQGPDCHREEPLTHNRFGGACERLHGASSACWPSNESFYANHVCCDRGPFALHPRPPFLAVLVGCSASPCIHRATVDTGPRATARETPTLLQYGMAVSYVFRFY